MAKPSKKVYLPVPYVPNGKTPFNFNGRAPSPLIVPEIGKQPKSDIDVVWDEMKKEKQAEQQLVQEMVENSQNETANLLDLSFNQEVYQPWAKEYGERSRPNSNITFSERLDLPNQWSLPPYIGFNWGTPNGSRPYYNPYHINESIPSRQAPRYELDLLKSPTPYKSTSIVTRKAAEKALEQRIEKEMAREAAIKQGLWGLGALGTGLGAMYGLSKLRDYINSSSEQTQIQEPVTSADVVSSYNSPAQVLKANQSLEQQYATQGLPLSTRPPQSYPVDVADEEPDLSDLIYPLDTIPRVSQRVNQQVRGYVRPTATSTPAPASTTNSTVTTQRPFAVRKQQPVSTGSSGPRLLNGPKVVNNQSNAPVTGNNLRAETSLARAMVSPPNPDALHRARYQSLMNSGLKGMSPDEAIRSGLLTPEQVQVLMRGPF